MKKLLSILLIMALVLSLAACGVKNNTEVAVDDVVEEVLTDETVVEEKEEVTEDVTEVVKPADKVETKPESKPEDKPDAPETKPADKVEAKPEAAPSTLGGILLADFKSKATSGMGAQEIADGLLSNSAIKFSGGAMPVEEGLLSGFDNAEITGFKNGVMFAPMIGSIPFVGYIFEVNDGVDVNSFISTLKSSANLRWNICVAADEMVTGSVGNKVFFVMCPTSLEE